MKIRPVGVVPSGRTDMTYLHLPQANLTIYQKGAYYSGIKIFNKLPLEIKNVACNQKKFKIALKKFLHTHSFYTLEEYLSYYELRTVL